MVEHSKEETLEKIGSDIKTISEVEKEALENPISLNKLNDCLKAMIHNISPGVSGFSGAFYKMFWGFLKYTVLASIPKSLKIKTFWFHKY